MAAEEFKRRLAAILSADVEGYSRLMREDEQSTVRTMTAYRTAIAQLIEQYRGRVVDSPGDNILSEFTSVVDAVNCAVEIQRELAERNAELPDNRRMRFRIGINLGDVLEEGKRIYGDGVNIASRMEGLAEAGGTCISGTVYDAIENKVGLEYEFLGEQEVKNINKPVRAYRVLSFPGAAAHRVVMAKSAVAEKCRKVGLALAAVLVIGVGSILAWQFYLRPAPPAVEVARVEKMAFPLPDKPSIAVLPFVNMSGDPGQDYISDGLTDYIITNLSSIPNLFVIASNSTFTYKGKPVRVQRVAEDLGVQYVLEGSMQKDANKVRLSVQLIDALSGHHLWAESYDRSLENLFVLQDEISMKIITSLQVTLAAGAYASAAGKSTKNLKALQCFWQGEYHFIRMTPEDNSVAGQYAEKAIEIDPEFSTAWALLGWVHLMDVLLQVSKSPAESLKRAGECAQKAIALNASCAKAYSVVSFLNLLQRKYDEAIKHGENAVALNPNDPHMLFILSNIMHFDGRFEESIAMIKKSMRLCPYYPATYLQFLARYHIMAGRYEEAIAAGKLLLSRSDRTEYDVMSANRSLAQAYIQVGENEQAKRYLEDARKINPKHFYTLVWNREREMRSYRDTADAERFLAMLEKVGLK